MKFMHRIRYGAVAGLIASLLAVSTAAFGASGDPNADPGGGIGGTGISGFGIVQRFGSIFVNGREYALTSDTHVTRDAQSANEAALRLGQVVTVQGHIDRASGRSVADSVNIRIVLWGRIDEVDPATNSFKMLGQRVYVLVSPVNAAAAGDALALPQLRTGETVTVSGLRRADGDWVATSISPTSKTSSGRFLVRGTAGVVDAVHGKIAIGAYTFQAAPELLAGTASGEQVVATGHYRNGSPVVTGMRRDQARLGAPGGTVEMSGYLQALPAPGLLSSNGVLLRISRDAVVTGGAPADLKPGSAIAVRGQLQPDGSIEVRELMTNIDPKNVTLPPGAPSGAASEPQSAGDHKGRAEVHPSGRDLDKPASSQKIDRPEIERPEVEMPEIERPDISVPEVDR